MFIHSVDCGIFFGSMILSEKLCENTFCYIVGYTKILHKINNNNYAYNYTSKTTGVINPAMKNIHNCNAIHDFESHYL